LQHCRDADPDEIRDVGVDNPGEAGGAGFDVVGEGELIESKECPDEGREDEEDVYGREEVVLEAKLKIGKGKIENKVQCEWERDHEGQLACVGLVKYGSIRHRDDSVEHAPYRPKDPRWWRPCGLD